jgi:hypothetical protein
MSQATADLVGAVGSNFIATIDAGTIVQAQLGVVGQAVVMLAIGADKRSVIVPNLPAGDSTIWLAIVWAPGEPNANIGVGAVTSGNVRAANPPRIVYDNNPVGVIEMFGI